MSNITTEQMRFWSPEVRELEPYVPGEQPKFQNLLKIYFNIFHTILLSYIDYIRII